MGALASDAQAQVTALGCTGPCPPNLLQIMSSLSVRGPHYMLLKEGEPRPQLTHPEDTLEPAPLPICTSCHSWFRALPWRVAATGCLHIAATQATRKHPQSHLAPSEHPRLLPPPSLTPATNSFGRSSGAHSSQTGLSLRRLSSPTLLLSATERVRSGGELVKGRGP